MPPRKKYTIEDLKEIAREKDGECLSSSVNTTKDYIHWKCQNNHVWKSQLKNILEGRWCPQCAINRQRHSIEKCHQLAQERHGKCLSSKYINTDTKLKWECEQGHHWMATPNKIKQGRWCPYCAGRHKTIDDYKEIASMRGGKCLSTEYISPHSPLTWECENGHTWEARPNNVKFGTWCPYCSGKHQTIEDMRILAQDRGGKCLSNQYIKQNSKLTWECKDGHRWKAVPNSVKSGSWCPKCKINYGEEIVRIYFESLFNQEFINTRPAWLEGLELDGYNEKLKLAFEHHGKQHYEFIGQFHKNLKSFENQLERDIKKRNICSSRGVVLIEVPQIPDLLSIEEFPRFLSNEFKDKGIQPPNKIGEVNIDLTKIYSQSQLEKLEIIAKQNGGKLLSSGYKGDRRKLWWQCKDGHKWQATPNGIKTGTWCPQCYGNIKKNINDIKELAAKKGLTLLSNEYKGTNKRLLWSCKYGHTWETTPKHIAHGTGCPKCAGNFIELSDVTDFANKYAISVISNQYKNNQQKLEFICENGHEFQMTWAMLKKHGKDSCPICRKEHQSNKRKEKLLNRLEKIVNEKMGRLLSSEYIDAKTKVHICCKEGHDWWAIPDSIRRGSWCPKCQKG